MGFPLPPELLPPILDYTFFPADFGALDSCCLVSRTWYCYARPYRFRVLRFITSREGIKEQLRRLRASPHLLPHITHVVLIQQSTWSANSTPWEAEDAKDLAKLVSQAQNLSIKNWSPRGHSQENFTAGMDGLLTFLSFVGTKPDGLNTISISFVSCPAPADVFRMLSSIAGSPRELRLDFTGHFGRDSISIASQDNNAASWMPVNPGWKLRALTLNTTELRQDVFSWLLSKAVDLSHLQKLTLVRFFLAGDMPIVPEVLRAIGSSLRELKLACRFEKPPMTNLHEILEQLPVLEKVIMGSDYYKAITLRIRSGLSLCTEMIRPLRRHDTIQEIVLAVDIKLTSTRDVPWLIDNPIASSPDWEALDTRLANLSSFPRFSRFHLIMEIVWTTPNGTNNRWTSNTDLCCTIQTRVRAALPRLDAKRAVVVSAEEITCYPGWDERIPESKKHLHASFSVEDHLQ